MQLRTPILQQILLEKNLDACIVSSPMNIAYLTHFFGFSTEEREAYLLITKEQSFLFTDARYTELTKQTVKNITTKEVTRTKRFVDHLKDITTEQNLKNIGFEESNITVAEFVALKKTGLRFVPFHLRELRISKTKNEIEAIRTAGSIANKSLKMITKLFKPGITEKEIANALEFEMKKLGADASFSTIVAFGKNAAVPHHLTGKTKLKTNDLILIDFGAKYDNYCSDTTRTFFRGKVPKEWKRMYQTVLEAQQKASDFIENHLQTSSSSEVESSTESRSLSHSSRSALQNSNKNIHASEVDKVAREYIISQGYPTIPHSLGHGIGLEVHEPPSLSPNSQDLLTEGMVFSIEPGIYIPGEMGVRIEDLFTIQNNQLTKLT